MPSPDLSREVQVLAADDARFAALLAGDVARLEQLLDPGCTYTHNSGLFEGREAYLERIRAGRVRYLSMQRHDVAVRLYGPTAVVTGYVIAQSRTFPDGVLHDRDTHFLAVWVEDRDQWRMVAYASTRRRSG